MDDLEEDMLDDAMVALQTKSKGEVLHQGVTTAPPVQAGVTTRAGRRKSEEGTSQKVRKKTRVREVSPVEEWEEEDHDPGAPPPRNPKRHEVPSSEEEGWLYTLLNNIQKTQHEILAKVNTLHEQAQQDRHRLHNMEMRVESLQQARMMGLTAQSTRQTSSLPSSGTTPRTGSITDGPVIL